MTIEDVFRIKIRYIKRAQKIASTMLLRLISRYYSISIKTVLLTKAHSLKNINFSTERADYIIVLTNGEIIESGTHENLLETGKYYRKFCNDGKE